MGYIFHAHCWVLVDRVIGHAIIEMNLKMFVRSIEHFWKENRALWKQDQFDNNYDDPFNPFRSHLDKAPQASGSISADEDLSRQVDTWQNPANIPEIHRLIEQAIQDHPKDNKDGHRSRNPPQSAACHIPVDIALLIMDTIYNDDNYNHESIENTQNMLTAFQWKLPDSYWQNRCKMDLIFEFHDILKSNNHLVDWQLLCLGTEKLLLDYDWYDRSGLKNRGRTLQLLERLKGTFLQMFEQDT